MTGGAALARRPAKRSPATAAHRLAPLLLGIPVLLGIALTLARLVSASHPDIGYATTPNSDAEVLYLGRTIYQDPDDGYTGQLYTPLFPALLSVLHHLWLWNGWPIAVNMAATLAMVGIVAALAYPRGAGGPIDRVARLAGAVGVGAVAWWLVSALGLNLLYEGRTDHLAFGLALAGLVLLAHGTRGATIASVLLLSAAFWAKQNTLVVSMAASLWMLAGAALGAWAWRRALLFGAVLLALNLAVLGLLSLLTDGWVFYFIFELGLNHPKVSTFGAYAREMLRSVGFALVLPALVAAGLAFEFVRSGARRPAARELAGSFDARLVSLLLAVVLIGFPAAVYFRTQLGGDVNQYIGVAWAMGMLLAVAYRRAAARESTALVAAGALALAFVVAILPGGKVADMNVAEAGQDRDFAELPAPLLDYAHDHLVYEQVHSDLNVEPQGSVYPNLYNWADLLSVGRQPRYLVDALLERRFDAVKPIAFSNPRELLFWEIYASGNGREESGYIWKLNRLIEAGYAAAPGVPEGYLARRPGPHPEPWLRACFGPFELGGIDWEIRDGGGLWCRAGIGALELRGTPAPVTEVHTEDPIDRLEGVVDVTLPRGRFEIRLRTDDDRRWKLRGVTRGREIELSTSLDGRPGSRIVVAPVRPGRLALDLVPAAGEPGALRDETDGRGDARIAVPVPSLGEADLSVFATRGSEARFGLGGLGAS